MFIQLCVDLVNGCFWNTDMTILHVGNLDAKVHLPRCQFSASYYLNGAACTASNFSAFLAMGSSQSFGWREGMGGDKLRTRLQQECPRSSPRVHNLPWTPFLEFQSMLRGWTDSGMASKARVFPFAGRVSRGSMPRASRDVYCALLERAADAVLGVRIQAPRLERA